MDVGLRAGAEIHFGFIDIPQLSLQGSIGVRYALDNTSVTGTTNLPPAAPVESTIDRSQSAFGTTVGDMPGFRMQQASAERRRTYYDVFFRMAQ